ncbi:MAG: alpha-L-fucosidase, partial [bacterium]|nr:alpha-L-fucosidase [bacterium]
YKQFNPVKFDAKEWVRIAKDAGMRYMVFTSKHHDGFCMWDTKTTDYNIMLSPLGRDVLRELSAACKEAGIAFGTYYSILDWYQPDYNTFDTQGGPGYALPEGQKPSMDRFQDYIESHVRELVENYGPLHSMWFDGEWEDPWTPERGLRLYGFCREVDPHMLVNNRVGKARQGMEGVTSEDALCPGDYDTPEQRVGTFNDQRPWETCMTICQQWAWKPDDRMKSLKQCIQTLVQTAGGDGNLLFSVGPMPDGRIEPRQVERLHEMGEWLRANGESIYGTRGGPYLPGEWGCSTHKGNTVYVHVFKWDSDRLQLPPLEETVQSATLLSGGQVRFT